MAVERDITWNIRHFQGALRCDRNFDVVYRVFRICGREACMFFVDGFAKDEIMEKLLEFFYGIQDEDLLRDAHTFSKSCVPYCEVAISGEEDTIVGQILSGVWAVFVDGMDQCVLIDQRTYPQRTCSGMPILSQSRVSPTVRWPSAGRRTPSWGRYCLEYGRCSWMEWTSAC